MITYTVPLDFVDQRDQRALKYNPRGRSRDQLLKDIDAELFEYYHIHRDLTDMYDDDRWEVDLRTECGETIDCKNITKWYNISQYKMCYLLRQHGVTDAFWFWEWVSRPDRPLEPGDEITMRPLACVPYWDVMKNIQPSKFNGGYYVDIRKHFV